MIAASCMLVSRALPVIDNQTVSVARNGNKITKQLSGTFEFPAELELLGDNSFDLLVS